MIVILLLIPLSIVIAAGFLGAFIWAVRSGQYEDTCTPSMRLLLEESREKKNLEPGEQHQPSAGAPHGKKWLEKDNARVVAKT
jgi:cbb3-type cytochrome oxidase maturation protein